MISRYELTKDQALYAIKNGEFGEDVLSYENVIVIMTQDWCPQWKNMSSWIYSIDTNQDINIFELVYNRIDYFRDFLSFKENRFGNSQVPYLRIYKNDSLTRETNYVSIQSLQSILESL